jgi:hypothetical protein
MHLRKYSASAHPAGDGIKACIRGNSIKPAAEGGPSFEAVESTPSTQKSLLDEVLSVVKRAEHMVAMELQLTPVGFGELLKRIAVALFGRVHQRRRIRYIGHVNVRLVHRDFFAVNINAMRRPTGLAAKYASDARHRITSSICRWVAAGVESPTPVPIAM